MFVCVAIVSHAQDCDYRLRLTRAMVQPCMCLVLWGTSQSEIKTTDIAFQNETTEYKH